MLRQRHILSMIFTLIALILPGILTVRPVAAAEVIIDVNFAKYPINTPVSEFTEPYMTFSTNGLGLARSREKDLQLYGGLTDLSITLSAPASQLQFDFD